MFQGKRDLIVASIKERIELQKDNYQGAFIANIRGFDIYIKGSDVIFIYVYLKDYFITKEKEVKISEATQDVSIIHCLNSESEAIEFASDFIIDNSFKI